jgi:hypothetical protein
MSGLPARLSRTPTVSVSATLKAPPEAELGRCHRGSACIRGRGVNQWQVNNYHERFKTWVNRQLRGVSTKHLPNYLAWMRLWEWFKEGIKPEHFVVSGLGRQLINVPATS